MLHVKRKPKGMSLVDNSLTSCAVAEAFVIRLLMATEVEGKTGKHAAGTGHAFAKSE